jgi:hypothetical protein
MSAKMALMHSSIAFRDSETKNYLRLKLIKRRKVALAPTARSIKHVAIIAVRSEM